MYGSLYSTDSPSSNGCSEQSFFSRSLEHIIHGKEGKMFVGGLSNYTSVDNLRNYFSKFGEIEECTIMRDTKTKLSRGFAFVTFFDPACIEKVLAISDHYLDGKKIDPQPASRNISPARSVHNTPNKLFVGGVSQLTSAEDLKAYFTSKFGEVEDVVLKIDYPKHQQHRGFGFITFVDPLIADRVCEVRYHTIQEKIVETKKAQKKEFVNLNADVSRVTIPANKTSSDQLFELYQMIVNTPPPMFSNSHPMMEQQPTSKFFVEGNGQAFRNRIAIKYLGQSPNFY